MIITVFPVPLKKKKKVLAAFCLLCETLRVKYSILSTYQKTEELPGLGWVQLCCGFQNTSEIVALGEVGLGGSQ